MPVGRRARPARDVGGDPAPGTATRRPALGAHAPGVPHPAPPAARHRLRRPARRPGRTTGIPGAPRPEETRRRHAAVSARPSGVVYVVSSDGILHVLGLPSGKDIQRPAEFLPANARLVRTRSPSTPRSTPRRRAGCGGAPNAVWAIDLDSDAKPVVSWKTNGGADRGRVAFATDGTLLRRSRRRQTTGDGKANAIVALDPRRWR